MTWKHVVTVLILTAGFFFTAWQAPLALVILIGSAIFLTKRSEE